MNGAKVISRQKEFTSNELDAVLKKRSKKVLERFGEVAISEVKDFKLLAILKNVINYWKDSFRPALTSFSCEVVGGKPDAADDAGLMFTLASSGFGLHDDILDKSSSKHLRNTILGLNGSDNALLVGDLLIFKAWMLVHEMIRKTRNHSKIADIVEAYGRFSIEVCEAEFMETLCRRNLEIDLEYYLNFQWKAMAEIEACSRIGAIMGNGKAKEVNALGEFGRRLGFVSRLADDIEDCLNLKGDLIHRIEFESVPLPLLYAAKSSTEKNLAIKHIIEKSQISPSDVKKLLGFCFETEAFKYVLRIARKNEEECICKLHALKNSSARNVLLSMIKVSCVHVAELCL